MSILRAISVSNIFIRHLRPYSTEKPIKQLTKVVHPEVFLKINSAWRLHIRPYDLLDCQDGNLIRASLYPTNTAALESDTKLDEYKLDFIGYEARMTIEAGSTNVEAEKADLLCVLEVPVKSNLTIKAARSVEIRGIGGALVKIDSVGDITTKNMTQSHALQMVSRAGDIVCEGNTVADKANLRVFADNEISINKIQGNDLEATCETGKITTNSCYVEDSKFIAIQGHLNLKNVHKNSEIYLPDGGSLNVTGFHGTLKAKTRGGNIYYQLTELYDNSSIQADSPDQLAVNISEMVEENVIINASAPELTLDTSLEHLKDYINIDGDLNYGNSDLLNDKLQIVSNGLLCIGRLSWMDTFKFNVK